MIMVAAKRTVFIVLAIPLLIGAILLAMPSERAEAAEYTPEWGENFGGSGMYGDMFLASITLSNGNVVSVGNSSSDDSGLWTFVGGFYDAIAVCYDTDGNLVWAKSYGGTGADTFYAVIEVDGVLYAAGESNGPSINLGTDQTITDTGDWGTGGSYDGILVSIDPADGTANWGMNYGGASTEQFYALASAGGVLYAAGDSRGANLLWGNVGVTDGIVVSIDPATGSVNWGANYGGARDDRFRVLTVIGDTLYATGYSSEASTNLGADPAATDSGDWGNAGYIDIVLVSIDRLTGAANWGKNYGGASEEYINALTVVGGSLLAAGYSKGESTNLGADPAATDSGDWGNQGVEDAILLSIDPSDGTVNWGKNYGGAADDYFNGSAIIGNSLFLAGSSGGASTNLSTNWSTVGAADALLVAVDPGTGTANLSKTYGGNEDDVFHSLVALDDTLYAAGQSFGASTNLGSSINWNNNGTGDAIAVKLSPHFFLTVTDGVDATGLAPYKSGSIVSITAAAAPRGMVFDSWVVVSGAGTFRDATSASTFFTIGSSDTVIAATYKASPGSPGTSGNIAATNDGSNLALGGVALSLIVLSGLLLFTVRRYHKHPR